MTSAVVPPHLKDIDDKYRVNYADLEVREITAIVEATLQQSIASLSAHHAFLHADLLPVGPMAEGVAAIAPESFQYLVPLRLLNEPTPHVQILHLEDDSRMVAIDPKYPGINTAELQEFTIPQKSMKPYSFRVRRVLNGRALRDRMIRIVKDILPKTMASTEKAKEPFTELKDNAVRFGFQWRGFRFKELTVHVTATFCFLSKTPSVNMDPSALQNMDGFLVSMRKADISAAVAEQPLYVWSVSGVATWAANYQLLTKWLIHRMASQSEALLSCFRLSLYFAKDAARDINIAPSQLEDIIRYFVLLEISHFPTSKQWTRDRLADRIWGVFKTMLTHLDHLAYEMGLLFSQEGTIFQLCAPPPFPPEWSVRPSLREQAKYWIMNIIRRIKDEFKKLAAFEQPHGSDEFEASNLSKPTDAKAPIKKLSSQPEEQEQEQEAAIEESPSTMVE